jgi:hypothetical protein
MCLIITGKSNKIRATLNNTKGLLDDIYTSNPDGIGIMYSTTKGLKVIKTLPKSLAEANAFINRLPDDDRELAIHFRWTTHGNTDMDNCHPYDVITGYVAMMHNGILHTGNKADTTKSDTWHFIKDYLSEAVHECPSLVHNQGFLTMVADFIGDNRFVFMDGEGRMSHVNYDQGVEHDGMWFSNTYAWVPSKLIPNYYKSTKKSYKSYYPSMYNDYGLDYDDYEIASWNHNITPKSKDIKAMATEGVAEVPYRYTPVHSAHWVEDDYADEFQDAMYAPDDLADKILRILGDCDADHMLDLLDYHAEETLTTLFDYFEPERNKYYKDEDASIVEKQIAKLIETQDINGLISFAYSSTLSEVICFYFDWTVRPEMSSALI